MSSTYQCHCTIFNEYLTRDVNYSYIIIFLMMAKIFHQNLLSTMFSSVLGLQA